MTIVALGAFAGCASPAHHAEPTEVRGPVGGVRAQLSLADGQVLQAVRYTVSGGPLALNTSGTVDLTNSTRLAFRVGNLPVGPDYRITLAATTVDGAVCAGGPTPFAIADNQVTAIALLLECRASTTGQDNAGDLGVQVALQEGTGKRCPLVSGITVLPSEVTVGGQMQIDGFAVGDVPAAVVWSSALGSFAQSNAASTVYTCTQPGDPIALTFAVSAAGCPSHSFSAEVTCIGSGDADAGTDAGSLDAGSPDAGSLDAGSLDAGSDAGSDAGPVLDAGAPPIVGKLTAIAAGVEHTCGLVPGGGVKCWGSDTSGQLGDGPATSGVRTTPVAVAGLGGSVTSLSAGLGEGHTCAILAGGTVQCWGKNDQGQLGNGTNVSSATPVDVVGLAGPAASVAIGQSHTCALLGTGAVQCWGLDSSGQLGNGGANTNSNRPSSVVGLAGRANSLAAGFRHTCVTLETGAVQCWGSNADFQLFGATGANATSATAVPGLAGPARDVAAGALHSCAVLDDGRVMCWGTNGSGQIGNGSALNTTTPVPPSFVLGLSTTDLVARIDSGDRHTCVVSQAGALKCWGFDVSGQIGNANVVDGNSVQDRAPQNAAVDVVGLSSGVVSVGGGLAHTCALLTTGQAKCWGRDDSGQIGAGTSVSGIPGDKTTPVDVLGFP